MLRWPSYPLRLGNLVLQPAPRCSPHPSAAYGGFSNRRLGALALWAVLLFGASVGGLVFIAGFAAYTTARQLLFPLRDIPRTTTHGPKLMLAAASAAALAATTALLLR